MEACERADENTEATLKQCDEFELSQQDYPCLNDLPAEPLNDGEKSGMVFMREEEKLARDVYLYLYELYSLPIFNNISKSEQRHTDAIKVLLDKYELEDPVKEDIKGSFKNKELQALYDKLIEQGSDKVAALKVGALIEETDILDLEKELTENVDNQDISTVYNNLLRGSHNHLRAFVNVLKINGFAYEPILLSQESFDSIIQKSS